MGTTPNTIILVSKYGRHEEDVASGTITPGHLIEVHDDGGNRRVQVHSTEGGRAERAWATEDALQGNEIDDDYSSGDLVGYQLFLPGDVVNAIIKAGEDITKGDKLISDGDGTLVAEGSITTGGTVEQVVAIAEEDLDLTATGAVDTRLACRVL